ncbi:MAG: hypothetical protein KBD64_00065 [Gammaproteobacteria bacterium]|nr:hypothetical protein [Gammaproteobacteria bacterium]
MATERTPETILKALEDKHRLSVADGHAKSAVIFLNEFLRDSAKSDLDVVNGFQGVLQGETRRHDFSAEDVDLMGRQLSEIDSVEIVDIKLYKKLKITFKDNQTLIFDGRSGSVGELRGDLLRDLILGQRRTEPKQSLLQALGNLCRDPRYYAQLLHLAKLLKPADSESAMRILVEVLSPRKPLHKKILLSIYNFIESFLDWVKNCFKFKHESSVKTGGPAAAVVATTVTGAPVLVTSGSLLLTDKPDKQPQDSPTSSSLQRKPH